MPHNDSDIGMIFQEGGDSATAPHIQGRLKNISQITKYFTDKYMNPISQRERDAINEDAKPIVLHVQYRSIEQIYDLLKRIYAKTNPNIRPNDYYKSCSIRDTKNMHAGVSMSALPVKEMIKRILESELTLSKRFQAG